MCASVTCKQNGNNCKSQSDRKCSTLYHITQKHIYSLAKVVSRGPSAIIASYQMPWTSLGMSLEDMCGM